MKKTWTKVVAGVIAIILAFAMFIPLILEIFYKMA